MTTENKQAQEEFGRQYKQWIEKHWKLFKDDIGVSKAEAIASVEQTDTEIIAREWWSKGFSAGQQAEHERMLKDYVYGGYLKDFKRVGKKIGSQSTANAIFDELDKIFALHPDIYDEEATGKIHHTFKLYQALKSKYLKV